MLKLVGGYKSPLFPSCSPCFVSFTSNLPYCLMNEYTLKDSRSYVYQGKSGKKFEGHNTL